MPTTETRQIRAEAHSTFPSAASLRSGETDLLSYIHTICDRIDAEEPLIQAFVPEPARRQRLTDAAKELLSRFPDPADRPPLFGQLVGVKDIFRVDGFATQAGSQLPATLFAGAEAAVVTRLKESGALIAGKTVTTEFAYFQPGPTRNPRNPAHTPGGSSSGSAAGVAAGFFPLALGTQTIGSIIRPGGLLRGHRLQAQLRPHPHSRATLFFTLSRSCGSVQPECRLDDAGGIGPVQWLGCVRSAGKRRDARGPPARAGCAGRPLSGRGEGGRSAAFRGNA